MKVSTDSPQISHIRMISNKSPISPTQSATMLGNTQIASPHAVHQSGSNVREKIKSIQHQISEQQIQIDTTNVQLKKVHRSLDPLRIAMKRYTDQVETRIREDVDKFIQEKQKQLESAVEQIEYLKNENLGLEAKVEKSEQVIIELSRCVEQLQSQVFANYDESESVGLNHTNNNDNMYNNNNNNDSIKINSKIFPFSNNDSNNNHSSNTNSSSKIDIADADMDQPSSNVNQPSEKNKTENNNDTSNVGQNDTIQENGKQSIISKNQLQDALQD